MTAFKNFCLVKEFRRAFRIEWESFGLLVTDTEGVGRECAQERNCISGLVQFSPGEHESSSLTKTKFSVILRSQRYSL